MEPITQQCPQCIYWADECLYWLGAVKAIGSTENREAGKCASFRVKEEVKTNE